MNYMPGTASLIEDIDKKHLVLLRDGRTLIGYLRSIDQFANLVLHQTVERIHVGKKYGDIPRGIFVVRGENVVLLGEILRTFKESAGRQEPESRCWTGRPNLERPRKQQPSCPGKDASGYLQTVCWELLQALAEHEG
uniref:U6 snRNA-associated Sm-like protein LSm1 n=1 Tax=Monodelphis domestica TaxID=13616 RepID=A0A5F8G3A0_MONDO